MLSTRLEQSKSAHVHGVQLSLVVVRLCKKLRHGGRRTRASKQALGSNHVPVVVVRRKYKKKKKKTYIHTHVCKTILLLLSHKACPAQVIMPN